VVERGKAAATRYQVLERGAGWSLLLCRLETGRTHQIRVHMAAIGHPLIGDPVYLPRGAARALPRSARAFARQALHATRLALIHPTAHDERVWESKMPCDMEALLAALKSDAPG
jgi:23S rRNA pseudouridine1911/1915/1917 synthase